MTDRTQLVSRIQAYFHRVSDERSSTDSFWADIDSSQRGGAQKVLLTGSVAEVAEMLADPAGNALLYGFDSLYKEQYERLRADPVQLAAERMLIENHLIILSKAMGASAGTVSTAIGAIAKSFGAPLSFPNPYPNELGVDTSRGTISYRPLQSIYQAWRLKQLGSSSVLEIGAGLGRTSYYAHQLGITDYTIVDLPLTNVAQAYFLAVTLGEDKVKLYGEPGFEDRTGVRIAPPSWLAGSPDKFDVVLNADSMTEMAVDTAREYLDHASTRARAFLSINHEILPFTMAGLFAERGWQVDRKLYPMREGYFEEAVSFR